MGETLRPGEEYADWKAPKEDEFKPSKEAEVEKPGETTIETP